MDNIEIWIYSDILETNTTRGAYCGITQYNNIADYLQHLTKFKVASQYTKMYRTYGKGAGTSTYLVSADILKRTKLSKKDITLLGIIDNINNVIKPSSITISLEDEDILKELQADYYITKEIPPFDPSLWEQLRLCHSIHDISYKLSLKGTTRVSFIGEVFLYRLLRTRRPKIMKQIVLKQYGSSQILYIS